MNPNDIVTIIDFVQSIGFTGLLIVLAIPKLRRFFFNGNGVEKDIKAIKENHLHDIAEKQDKLLEQQVESLFILREIKRILEKTS